MLVVKDRRQALDLDIAVALLAERMERGEVVDVEDAIRRRKSGIAALKAFQMRINPSAN